MKFGNFRQKNLKKCQRGPDAIKTAHVEVPADEPEGLSPSRLQSLDLRRLPVQKAVQNGQSELD